MAVGAARLRLPVGLYAGDAASPPAPPCCGRRWRPPLSFGHSCPRKRLLPLPLSCSAAVGAPEREGELAFTDLEVRLIEGLLGVQGRGRSATSQQLKEVDQAVKDLEHVKGVPEPRTFVGFDGFLVFQEVYLRSGDPRVSNIVRFSDAVGELKVEAEATIKDGVRILFRFDRAAFSFKALPFKVPYPVPFRLLGDEAKGWLDTTYLSQTGNIRISRGNKGTTFVLQKRTEPRQRLLSAISTGDGVKEAMDELISLSSRRTSEEEEALLEGEWQLLWASQMIEESLPEAAAAGLKGLQIFRGSGRVENLVDIFPGFKLCTYGSLVKSDDSYDITMSDGAIMVGSVRFLLDVKRSYSMQLLYIDNKIRITRGYKDTIFIHVCADRPNRR